VLEEGCGLGVGVPMDANLDVSGRLRVGSYGESLDQDVVVVLRCPEQEELRRLRPGAVLARCCNYPTRPDRTALLADLGVRAFSLDAITDRSGRRLVENLEAVAWNGVGSPTLTTALHVPVPCLQRRCFSNAILAACDCGRGLSHHACAEAASCRPRITAS
jgi:NAD/NADP transhydrogenase alpha subunit